MINVERFYQRFTKSDRIEHWVQVISFATLAVTGLVQKFSLQPISIGVIQLLGGIESVRIIHRYAVGILMIGAVFHIGSAGYKIFVLRNLPKILPAFSDIKVAWGSFLYNFNLRKEKPQEDRYTFDEKFEYWAFVWGTIIMGITGFMLWNPIATTNILPGDFIPAAKAAHGGEAILATLAILVWHFYHVHIKHLNKSMFTGNISGKEMLEEHPLELADLKAGVANVPVDPALVAKRSKYFFPIYSVIAAIMLFGLYLFVAYEKTAIETVPPAENVVIYAPLTPTPLPTPIPTKIPETIEPGVKVSWNSTIGALLADRCGSCHNNVALGGLDITGYQSTLDGGVSGEAVIPLDPDKSIIVIRQASGDHPGQFSVDELIILRDWIELGAPEE